MTQGLYNLAVLEARFIIIIFFYRHHGDYFFSTAKSSDLSSFPDASEALLIYTGRVGANCSNVFGKMERTDPAARLALD